MAKYTIQVTETINHTYEIEAETEEDALTVYYSYDNKQLEELDQDGQSSWDSLPWDITETKEQQ